MNIDLASLFPDLEALTTDGRWGALQSWLKENPEYAERVDKWATQTVDEVFSEISVLASKKYGTVAIIAFAVPAISAKIKSTITILQACYRERQAMDNQQQKEINNATTRGPVKRRSQKNHR